MTEGETAFGEMSGSSPVSIHQQALRGIALVALERGDKAAAMAQVSWKVLEQQLRQRLKVHMLYLKIECGASSASPKV